MDWQQLMIQGEWMLRIFVAVVCGCLIGSERTSRNKEAGLRTHAILALGSSMIMVVSKYGFSDMLAGDGARLAAQVVSGIGFLGAGVIFVRRGSVTGLTTAAGMWTTSGIGLSIGAGLYGIGIMSTILIIGMQTLFHKGIIVNRFKQPLFMQLEVVYQKEVLKRLEEEIVLQGLEIHDMKVEKLNADTMFLELELNTPRVYEKHKLIAELAEQEYVVKVNFS